MYPSSTAINCRISWMQLSGNAEMAVHQDTPRSKLAMNHRTTTHIQGGRVHSTGPTANQLTSPKHRGLPQTAASGALCSSIIHYYISTWRGGVARLRLRLILAGKLIGFPAASQTQILPCVKWPHTTRIQLLARFPESRGDREREAAECGAVPPGQSENRSFPLAPRITRSRDHARVGREPCGQGNRPIAGSGSMTQ